MKSKVRNSNTESEREPNKGPSSTLVRILGFHPGEVGSSPLDLPFFLIIDTLYNIRGIARVGAVSGL